MNVSGTGMSSGVQLGLLLLAFGCGWAVSRMIPSPYQDTAAAPAVEQSVPSAHKSQPHAAAAPVLDDALQPGPWDGGRAAA